MGLTMPSKRKLRARIRGLTAQRDGAHRQLQKVMGELGEAQEQLARVRAAWAPLIEAAEQMDEAVWPMGGSKVDVPLARPEYKGSIIHFRFLSREEVAALAMGSALENLADVISPVEEADDA